MGINHFAKQTIIPRSTIPTSQKESQVKQEGKKKTTEVRNIFSFGFNLPKELLPFTHLHTISAETSPAKGGADGMPLATRKLYAYSRPGGA